MPTIVKSSSVGSLVQIQVHHEFKGIGYLRFHQRQEGGFDRVYVFKLVRILAQEKGAFVDQFADHQSKYLAEISAGDHLWKMRYGLDPRNLLTLYLLESLFTRFIGSLIHGNVIFCSWKVLVHVRIKGTLSNMRDRCKAANL